MITKLEMGPFHTNFTKYGRVMNGPREVTDLYELAKWAKNVWWNTIVVISVVMEENVMHRSEEQKLIEFFRLQGFLVGEDRNTFYPEAQAGEKFIFLKLNTCHEVLNLEKFLGDLANNPKWSVRIGGVMTSIEEEK